jgi:glycerol kinase
MEQIAVLDVGSSSLRASIVDASLAPRLQLVAPLPVDHQGVALVTFDADRLRADAFTLLGRLGALARIDAVAITNQRASAIAFDRESGIALAPALGWQDLRTAPRCLELGRQGLALAPNQSATKYAWLRAQVPDTRRLGLATIDGFLAAALTHERALATDATNAAMTGLIDEAGQDWDDAVLGVLGLEREWLGPIVANDAPRGTLALGDREVPLVVTVADQQASLLGQRTRAKLTLGTSGVADLDLGEDRPRFARRGPAGCFPLLVARLGSDVRFGLEAFWMSAGSAVDWLVATGALPSAKDTEALAATADRHHVPVVIPAHQGLGAPIWDFGGRGVLAGLGPATGRAELALGLLLGIAATAAELLAALERDAGICLEEVGLDGKLGANPVVARAIATMRGHPVLASSCPEATTVGAARLVFGLARDAIPAPREVPPEADGFARAYLERYLEHRQLATEAIPVLSRVRF